MIRLCGSCGAQFEHHHSNALYCSGCRRADGGGLRSSLRSYGPIECGVCGCKFYASRRDTQYCGSACAHEVLSTRAAALRKARAFVKHEVRVYRKWAVRAAKSKEDKDRAAKHRQALARNCKECGSAFVARNSRGAFCSPTCSLKDQRRTARRKRRAQIKGARTEPVNPTTVFNRDSWTCQLCGASTPKWARGTCDDCAPELDHIVPLARGGEHSYKNTQCLCRGCNHNKSDSLPG